MSRGHTEIAELTRRMRSSLEEVGDSEARRRAARLAIELYAVLRLRFTQEEENFHVLADVDAGAGPEDLGRGGPQPPTSA
ncbi:hypothetical protein ACFWTE_17170 [Nocardiopsis sp. NPDC058631]|uniref:hypothetical protein n=1 Tax=Nocardiopsis sp. NPDC058631 TaxID=3346566 RepID=UPI003659BF67